MKYKNFLEHDKERVCFACRILICSLKFFFSFDCKIYFVCPFRWRMRMIYTGWYMVNKKLLASKNVWTKLSQGCENSYQEL